ncbi:adherens junction-associated protein 1 [Bombina bombina]|uniref:adherens junction-associated protein 1 n=1 Tax=Bombina bombina TaxID=8345 RepID=UPI00235A7F29|nr:adherens junction-associated protein 1 [Bombina bombina]
MRSGPPLGSHVWILIAMLQLAIEFIICEAGSPKGTYKYLQRSSLHRGIHHTTLLSLKGGQKLKNLSKLFNQFTIYEHLDFQAKPQHLRTYYKNHLDNIFSRNIQLKHLTRIKSNPSIQGITNTLRNTHLKRGKRQVQRTHWDSLKSYLGSESQPTTISEFILWGPTGDDELVESSTLPGILETTRTSTAQTRTTLLETTTTTTTSTTSVRGITSSQNPGNHKRKKNASRISTTEPSLGNGKAARPPRIPNETSGLAVHQIITITVSLIMVIAALITTLVLKNCCAQSGNARRNSHQRKINQQEESCQNLTDFTPARVPSNMDIFTAYNETLQCSHECVRTPVPVYTDEALHQTGAYKTTFNGNRPTSSDRHLIPVAFVSEKWFEISC